MKINLISNLNEDAQITELKSYNHVVAWNLKKALTSLGHTATLIQDSAVDPAPPADHAIVISNYAMTRLTDLTYTTKLCCNVRGKFCLWLDSDFGSWEKIFDLVFCVNKSHGRNPAVYHHVGWAADPELFRPQQTLPAAFVDPFMWGWYEGRHDGVYSAIQKALQASGVKVVQPVEVYNKGRVSWLEMAAAMRQCSYFVNTQIANWGLTLIEAATCGALILMHEDMDLPHTWATPLNYALWNTERDLEELLRSSVDVQANREKAMCNTWPGIAAKITELLQ